MAWRNYHNSWWGVKAMINIEQRTDSSAKMVILAPILALTLTAISTMIIFLWASLDVMNAFYVFYIEPLTGKYNLSELLVKAAPLMMIALGLSIGFRAGVWNIGAEGQYIIGAISGGAVGLYYYNVEATWLNPPYGFCSGSWWDGLCRNRRIPAN